VNCYYIRHTVQVTFICYRPLKESLGGLNLTHSLKFENDENVQQHVLKFLSAIEDFYVTKY